MRFLRRSRIVVLPLVVALVLAVAIEAHAAAPVRSGTIVLAYRSPWLLEATPTGCEGAPECLAWLVACPDAPTTRVGVQASIVDVRWLAGSPRKRTFAIVDRVDEGVGSLIGGGVTVELWDRSCEPVRFSIGPSERVRRATFRIPRSAGWMTVANAPAYWGPGGSYAGVALRWELR